MQWRHDSWLSLIFIQVNKLGFPYTQKKNLIFFSVKLREQKRKKKKILEQHRYR